MSENAKEINIQKLALTPPAGGRMTAESFITLIQTIMYLYLLFFRDTQKLQIIYL
jgi:hypothetical protein